MIRSVNLEGDARESILSYDDKVLYISSKTGFSYYNTETMNLIEIEELGS